MAATITRSAASPLFPVGSTTGTTYTDRDAERRLTGVPDDAVVIVAPDSMASGYALNAHELTVIVVETLPDAIRDQVSAASGLDLSEYRYIRIGQTNRSGRNRSLAEF